MTQNRSTLPSLSNILNPIEDSDLRLNLPPIVNADPTKDSYSSSKSISADIHEKRMMSPIMDLDDVNWMDSHEGMDYKIPASPPMTDVSSNYDMYDWGVPLGGYDEISIDSKPLAVGDDLAIANPVITLDTAMSEVEKPVYSIFTETKKRAEKCRHDDDEMNGGGKVAVDYKSRPVTKKTRQTQITSMSHSDDSGQS
jgi:hypothetical protein